MNQDTVESISPMSDRPHPTREWAAGALQAHYEAKKAEIPPLPVCTVHDESRGSGHPAPALDIRGALDRATYKVK